jgi:CHRD domain
MPNFSRRAAFVAVFALVGLASAGAQEVGYSAKMDGAAETPPNTTKGAGAVQAQYDPATKKLTWTITYSGLTGPAVAAHFHGPAPAGTAAGVMVPITGSLDSPIKGSATLTDDQAKALTGGMMYFNIHTAEHKPGEIRGQLMTGM